MNGDIQNQPGPHPEKEHWCSDVVQAIVFTFLMLYPSSFIHACWVEGSGSGFFSHSSSGHDGPSEALLSIPVPHPLK